MARFSVDGLDGLEDLFGHIRDIPYWVLEEMLDKQADVVVAAQRKTAASMLDGPYNKRAVQKAIKKGKTKRTRDGLVKHIAFNGKQHGVRLAEIAFVNEYGKRGQPAPLFSPQMSSAQTRRGLPQNKYSTIGLNPYNF